MSLPNYKFLHRILTSRNLTGFRSAIDLIRPNGQWGRRLYIISICLVAFILSICFIRQDYLQSKQIHGWMIESLSISPITYNLTLDSFNYTDKIVHGRLQLEFKPHLSLEHHSTKSKYLFSPLVFKDLTYLLASDIDSKYLHVIKLLVVKKLQNQREFYLEPPKPLKIEMNAIGEPHLYPFDTYFVAGMIKCIIKEENGGMSKALRDNNLEKIVFRPSISGLLLYDANLNGMTLKGAGILEEYNEFWGQSDKFLMKLKRPLFLKSITIFFGICALLWSIYFPYCLGLWSVSYLCLSNYRINRKVHFRPKR